MVRRGAAVLFASCVTAGGCGRCGGGAAAEGGPSPSTTLEAAAKVLRDAGRCRTRGRSKGRGCGEERRHRSERIRRLQARHGAAAARAKLGNTGACIASIDATRARLQHFATWPADWVPVDCTACGASCVATKRLPDGGDGSRDGGSRGDDGEGDGDGDGDGDDDTSDGAVVHRLFVAAPGGGFDALQDPVVVMGADAVDPSGRCGQGMVWLDPTMDDAEPLHLRVVCLVTAGMAFDYETDDAGDQQAVGWHCASEGSEDQLVDVFIDRPRHERRLRRATEVSALRHQKAMSMWPPIAIHCGVSDERTSCEYSRCKPKPRCGTTCRSSAPPRSNARPPLSPVA